MLTPLLENQPVAASDLIFQDGDSADVVYSASVGIAVFVTHDIAEILRSASGDVGDRLRDLVGEEMVDQLVQAEVLWPKRGSDPSRHRRSLLEQKIQSARTIRFLDLVVSEGCNYGCPHCIHSRDVETGPFRMLNTYMTIGTARAAIDEFVRLQRTIGNDHLAIHIGSAEPLINWKTTHFIVQYVNSIDGFAKKRVTINTNLSLLSEDRARFLISHGVIISTSLDGVKEDNDTIRILKNGAGTFDVILEKIQMLRMLGYLMDSVSLTVTGETIRKFNSTGYIDLLKRLGMTGVSIDFDLVGSADIAAEEVSSFLLAFYDLCTQNGIECFGTWTKPFENLFMDQDDPEAPPMPGFCKAVEGGNISVSPQGGLFMCGYTSSMLGNLGGMMQQYPETLLNLLARRTAVVESHCKGCELIAVCGGQCHTTHEVASFEQSPKVNVMCDIYRTVTRELAVRKVNREVN